MTYYLAIVFVLYFFILITLLIGWNRATQNQATLENEHNYISVVIATRNEQENILNLLNSLLKLNYLRENFEVIIVDDHSEDETFQLARDFFQETKIGRVVLQQEGEGKKAALAFGIAQAKGNIVATTDADCFVPTEWLHRINQMFQNKNLHLCIGAVKIIPDGKIFSSLQSMEFASVIGTGASTLGFERPTMCNGANLSFRKKTFEEVSGYEGNLHYASGDDQFLMAKIYERFKHSVAFMPYLDSVVSTLPLNSLSAFFNQRVRWAGKWSALSMLAKALAAFTFLVQVSWVVLIFSVFTIPPWMTLLILIKIFLEFIFLIKAHRFLSLPFQPISFLLLQFMYAPYVIGTAIFSQFNAFVWKGRRHAG